MPRREVAYPPWQTGNDMFEPSEIVFMWITIIYIFKKISNILITIHKLWIFTVEYLKLLLVNMTATNSVFCRCCEYWWYWIVCLQWYECLWYQLYETFLICYRNSQTYMLCFFRELFFSISTLFRRFYFAKVCLHAPSSLIVSTALQMSCLLRQITSFILSASCVSMLISVSVWILYSSVLNGYKLVSYG